MFSHDAHGNNGNIPSPLRLDVHVVELNPYVPLHVAQCLLGIKVKWDNFFIAGNIVNA